MSEAVYQRFILGSSVRYSYSKIAREIIMDIAGKVHQIRINEITRSCPDEIIAVIQSNPTPLCDHMKCFSYFF